MPTSLRQIAAEGVRYLAIEAPFAINAHLALAWRRDARLVTLSNFVHIAR